MTGKSEQSRSKQETPSAESSELRDEHCPVVGIGASAGGLAAFEAFFSALPADTDHGMAFILVQHLAPDHESMLSGLIRRYTRMQVCEVEDGMPVQPNSIYIIPPNRDMALLNGRLQLLEPAAPRGHRFPIDFFFRSLAQDQHERAIGIILSGTGSDGTQGARAIKAEGGLVMAQTPGSAGYDGMPLSALGTGLVDYELPPAEMPAQLKDYVDHSFSKPVKSEPDLAVENDALQKIFVILRTRIGHDFSAYKPSTIHRRIERRMAIQRIETMSQYVKFLHHSPAEGDALFHDLLIGVTGFFRDPAAFQAMEQLVIPPLFADKPADAIIRAWVPGCSTGEEAYSLAILLHEQLIACKQNFRIQIFATDIDNEAVAAARTSIYPISIAADISAERLARFFTIEPDGNGYRLHKSIRDLVIFSGQDVLKDPPFSRIDLVSCRNLMIYLRAEVQEKLILLFHYALNPGGFLFLGTSETVRDVGELFTVVDRKSKIYRKDETLSDRRGLPNRFLKMTAVPEKQPRATEKRGKPVQLSLGALTEQTMLKQIAPAAALVNRSGDILYLHGRTGMYLEPSPGEAGVNNILKMARQGLRDDLTLSLHKAAGSTATVRRFGLRVLTNGDYTAVNLTVCPVTSDTTLPQGEPLFLVILQETPPLEPGQMQQAAAQILAGTDGSEPARDGSIEALRQELRAKEEYLQAANEKLETANEELKSSNEEMQSINEKLQSTIEEMETSKVELQAVNEELATVNSELQAKVADLSRANNDMNNLLAGTGIGTVFVDRHLRILRFTPAAVEIINLIPSDIGRPVRHLAANMVGYDRLVADVQAVLDTLIPHEVEVLTTGGKWYMMRIQPYRTLDYVIEGAVITFVDTTELKLAQDGLRRLAVVVEDAHDAITVQDLEGRILAWNPSATRMYGWNEAEVLSMNIRDLIPDALHEQYMGAMEQLSQTKMLEPYRTQRIARGGRVIDVSITATALVNASGKMYAIATTERVEGMS